MNMPNAFYSFDDMSDIYMHQDNYNRKLEHQGILDISNPTHSICLPSVEGGLFVDYGAGDWPSRSQLMVPNTDMQSWKY